MLLLALLLPAFCQGSLDRAYRLPRTLRPSAYRLHFNYTLPPTRLQDGFAEIDFATTGPVRDLQIHSRDHVFLEQGMLKCGPSEPAVVLPFPYRDMDKQIAVFEGVRIPAGRNCTMRLPYKWSIVQEDNRGPFIESLRTFHLITKFQPIYARLLFPCFDEPHLKATFQLNVYVLAGTDPWVLVKSNMEKMPRSLDTGRVRHSFAASPVMSTYLVALTISNASIPIYSTRRGGLPRVEAMGWVRTKQLSDTARLIQHTTQILNRRFPVQNPLRKITFAKVSKYPSGATEHWGLITSRSMNTMITVHETVHQWFGNLVTCASWADIWLNEGLTNFVNCQTMDELRQAGWPVWTSGDCFGKWRRHAQRDALSTDLRLSDERNYPVFHVFPYTVGPTLLRMLNAVLGDALLRTVLDEYIRRFAYSTATSSDFVDLFTQLVSPKHPQVRSWKAGSPIRMRAFLDSWIHQPHMPNVTIGYDQMHREFVLRQSCPIRGCQGLWYLPIRSYSPKLRSLSPFYWLTPEQPEIRVRTNQVDLVWNPSDETYANLHFASL